MVQIYKFSANKLLNVAVNEDFITFLISAKAHIENPRKK